MTTVADCAAHIARVCKIEDIKVLGHTRGGRAYRRSRWIKIRPVKSAITYAVALHEIGHILGPRQNETRLYAEVGAWEWAKANAIVWNYQMEDKLRKSLLSYLRWSERKKRVKKAGPDHPIHALIAGSR